MVKKKKAGFTVATYREIPVIPDDESTYNLGESDKPFKNVIYGKALWKQMNIRPSAFEALPKNAYPKTGFHPCSVCGELKDNMMIIWNRDTPDEETVICKECYEESQYTSKW